MERYINNEGDVIKYIHENGTETAIKIAPGCSGRSDKVAVFLSSSVGCKMKCLPCYVTGKNIPYEFVMTRVIINNAIRALTDAIAYSPNYNKPLKISWMGMGEALFMEKKYLTNGTRDLMNFAPNGILDGIDIGTCCPKSLELSEIIEKVQDIQSMLHQDLSAGKITINPFITKFTGDLPHSIIRLFYSLHSVNDETKKKLVPGSYSVDEIGEAINLTKRCSINPVIHYTLLSGINDRDEDVESLLTWIKKYKLEDVQIRILNYNKCPNSKLNPSERTEEFVNKLMINHQYIKSQISPGKEVSAACGMFLWKK